MRKNWDDYFLDTAKRKKLDCIVLDFEGLEMERHEY